MDAPAAETAKQILAEPGAPVIMFDHVQLAFDDKVVLNIEAEEARRRWQSENRSRALFEREDLGRRGPHVLNRSFAGTYSDEE